MLSVEPFRAYVVAGAALRKKEEVRHGHTYQGRNPDHHAGIPHRGGCDRPGVGGGQSRLLAYRRRSRFDRMRLRDHAVAACNNRPHRRSGARGRRRRRDRLHGRSGAVRRARVRLHPGAGTHADGDERGGDDGPQIQRRDRAAAHSADDRKAGRGLRHDLQAGLGAFGRHPCARTGEGSRRDQVRADRRGSEGDRSGWRGLHHLWLHRHARLRGSRAARIACRRARRAGHRSGAYRCEYGRRAGALGPLAQQARFPAAAEEGCRWATPEWALERRTRSRPNSRSQQPCRSKRWNPTSPNRFAGRG